MKAKFGAIVVAGSGKLGGHVASRNRAGAYFRTKVTPINPRSVFQTVVRNRLTSLSQSWRGLNVASRNAWNAAVASFSRTDVFGDLKNPSGFNLYQRLNNNLLTIGQPQLVLPPLVQFVFALTTLAVNVAAGVMTIVFTDVIPATASIKLFATPGQSAGVNFVKSEYRLLAIMDSLSVTPFDITAAYTARFGAPVVGTKIFVKLVSVREETGQEGTPLTAFTTVTP